ncbi:MAG: LacI family transcriptional regulator [Bacilli bacterium]|jgi:LacI family transcriptional regulator|nr:LacI family transcriptional regulator [Bacilli bacterium]
MADNMKDRATIYGVAKRAGVSLATVSRVINGKNNVTEKTKKQVTDAIKELGYRPSALARGLATNKSTNIGIVIPGTNYVYICNMLSGMTDIAKIYGYQTTLFVTRRSKEDAQKEIEKLISSHVDGAVIFDDELDENEIKYIQNYNIPLVVIGHEMSDERLASITLDYKSTLIDITKDYYERTPDGQINFLDITMAGNMMDDLRDNLLQYTSANGKSVSLIHSEDSYQRLYSDMKVYFETPSHRHGLFICPRDSLACAVINAAIEDGVKIPDEIEVISVVGTKYSYIVRPQVSSLEIDLFEVGSIAMRMLTKLLKGELDQKVFRFKSQFAVRGSTKK